MDRGADDGRARAPRPTRNAVLQVTEAGLKRSLRSPHLLAAAVIVDPELTVELPPARHRHVRARRRHAARRGSCLAQGESVHLVARAGSVPAPAGSPRAAWSTPRGTSGFGPPRPTAHSSAASRWPTPVSARRTVSPPDSAACSTSRTGSCARCSCPHVLEANADVIRDRVAELAGGRSGRADPVAVAGRHGAPPARALRPSGRSARVRRTR